MATTTNTTFDEVRKKAYSHGLEAIYAIETIDIKSLRQLQVENPQKSAVKVEESHFEEKFTFDLGPGFREWITPFILQEPVQVLELSKNALKILLDQKICDLKKLLECDLRSFAFSKGVGQGHIVEIEERFQSYIAGKSLKKANSIDFSSWLRVISFPCENRKKVHVYLETFNLQEWLPISPMESSEIKRLPVESKEEWRQVGQTMLKNRFSDDLKNSLNEVATELLRPWIRRRNGIATQDEVLERLERVCVGPSISKNFLELFSALYFEGNFPFASFLATPEAKIYCDSESSSKAFQDIVKKAKTYFYKEGIFYNFDHLVSLLSREFAVEWTGFSEGFIEKVLRNSAQFKASSRSLQARQL